MRASQPRERGDTRTHFDVDLRLLSALHGESVHAGRTALDVTNRRHPYALLESLLRNIVHRGNASTRSAIAKLLRLLSDSQVDFRFPFSEDPLGGVLANSVSTTAVPRKSLSSPQIPT